MKNLKTKIYAFKFFDDFILIYSFYAVMFVDFGMQPWQVSTLFVVWSVTALLLEVPSGVLADMYSRKRILFAAQIIRACGYITWLLFPTFWGFLIGFVLWGIKSALTSGTFEALVYDELKKHNEEHEYTKVIGRSKSASFVAIFIASIVASPIIIFGYTPVLLISIIAIIISAVIAILLPKAEQVESTHEKEYFAVLSSAIKEVLKNKIIFKIIIFLTLVIALGGTLDEYWPILSQEAGLPKVWIGILLAIVSGAQALAAFFAHKLDTASQKIAYILFIINGLVLIALWYFFSIPSLILLIVFSFIFTLTQTLYESKLQHSLPDETRATISSITGLTVGISALVVYAALGMFAQMSETNSYSYGLPVIGLLIVGIGLVYLIANKLKQMGVANDKLSK